MLRVNKAYFTWLSVTVYVKVNKTRETIQHCSENQRRHNGQAHFDNTLCDQNIAFSGLQTIVETYSTTVTLSLPNADVEIMC